MSTIFSKLKYILFFILILSCAACAPSKKNKYNPKKREVSTANTSQQLGRNRYYYSPGYKKKLDKSYKKVK